MSGTEWIYYAVALVASTAYQMEQQKKMRQKAAAAAESRKGFEIPVDGQIISLPTIYGRAKIGGVRAYHTTRSSFKHAPSNGDISFMTGPPARPGGSYSYQVWDEDAKSWVNESQVYSAREPGLLNRDIGGSKNEFLFFDQALCTGGISRVIDVIFNGNQFIDDPALGTYTVPTNPATNVAQMGDISAKAALRVDCHYEGGVADAMMTANIEERSTAYFTSISYASVCIRLDRDNPQFQGVPDLQFLVEGTKIRTFDNLGALSATKTYSNNPAECLLDYLTNSSYGKGVNISKIDLPSFANAAAVCRQKVQLGAACGGRIWRPTNKLFDITARDLPLYECNIILDNAKPLRDNVESILTTMGDARLVWSQGKYKLQLQYPATNDNIIVSGTITDDEIYMADPVEVIWPSASERLNYATVRFNNEAENFEQDSISWPPKYNSSYKRGVGGIKYPSVSGWSANRAGGVLLNSFGVWSGSENTCDLEYKVAPKETGLFVFKMAADDNCTFEINHAVVQTTNNWRNVYTFSVNMIAGQIYTLSANIVSTYSLKGFALTITAPSGVQLFNTRQAAYTGFVEVNQSSAIYDTLKAEDNGVMLETDLFAEGVTDYYHALAKAEEIVRTSRTAFNVNLSYIVKDKYYESGDFIRLSSSTLNLGDGYDLYFKVNSSKLKEGGISELNLSRFDYTQLAWNVKDDEYLVPRNAYDSGLAPPYSLVYVATDANTALAENSTGYLVCDPVSDSRLIGYIFYAHVAGEMDEFGQPMFREQGRTTAPDRQFVVKNLSPNLSYIFGVRSLAKSGAMSSMTTTSLTSATLVTAPIPPAPAGIDVQYKNSAGLSTITVDWKIPLKRLDGTFYKDHYVSQVSYGTSNSYASVVLMKETTGLTASFDTNTLGNIYVFVNFVSSRGSVGPAISTMLTLTVGGSTSAGSNPPTPTGFTGYPGVGYYAVQHNPPIYTEGGGHMETVLYGKVRGVNDPIPTFANAVELAHFTGNYLSVPADPATKWHLWIKWKAKNGLLSLVPAGGVNGLVLTTAYDVAKLIDALSGQISQSELATDLSTKIDNAANGVTSLTTTVSGHTSTLNTLSTTVGNNSVAIANETSARINTDNSIVGKYSVKIDINGFVSGFGLIATANNATPYSQFIFAANSFAIGAPGLGSDYPFIVQTTPTTVNGQYVPAGVYIKNAYIANGTITSAMMGIAIVKTANIEDLNVAGKKIVPPTHGSVYIGRGGMQGVWHGIGRKALVTVHSVVFNYTDTDPTPILGLQYRERDTAQVRNFSINSYDNYFDIYNQCSVTSLQNASVSSLVGVTVYYSYL